MTFSILIAQNFESNILNLLEKKVAYIPQLKILHFPPNKAFRIILPILRSIPALDVGIPVSLANFCFACVIPSALFHEKERPGIPVLDLRFAIITNVLRIYYH